MVTILALTAAALATPPGLADLTFDADQDPEFIELRPADIDINAIWNGQETSEYPNVVALANMSQGHIFCSGTLIDGKWILTAAHCLSDQDWALSRGDLFILWGNDIRNEGYSEAIEWKEFYQHPDYDAYNFRNDIGLVELKSQKTGVDFAVLNDEGMTSDWYDEILTFVGFGITSSNANNSGTKRTTQMPIDSYDSQYVYSEDDNTNVCSGDSGGAAFETKNNGNLELAGVNAFIYPSNEGCEGGNNGATRVDVYIPWIIGYVPDVILAGSGEGSGGEGDGNGNGGNGDNPFDNSIDMDEYDRDFGDANRPIGAKYPKALRCASGPIPGSLGWLGILGALAVASRRRD